MPRSTLPRTVLALSLVSLFTDMSSEMIYPLVPTFLAGVLGAGAMTIGAIEGAAESLSALLKYVAGAWSDRSGRRKPIVVAGYAIASAARPLIGLARSVGDVFVIRMVDRIGKGIRSAPRDALIADSVSPDVRGRAFGLHRSADHLGAVLGPLIAYLLLESAGLSIRLVFLLAAIPAAMAMLVLVLGVQEPTSRVESIPPAAGRAEVAGGADGARAPDRRFAAYLLVLALFTLGNSTDAYLLLRAQDLGVATGALPLLWAALHVVKTLATAPGGRLSDTLGRRPLIVAGWLVYALVYLGLARATDAWHAWALFLAYGVFFGLTEGVEKALVADLVPASARGRAFGWFNLTIAAAALPASLLFGFVWERWSAEVAFTVGATLAAISAIALTAVLRSPGRVSSSPG